LDEARAFFQRSFGTQMSGYGDGEITLAHKVLPALKEGMLCLADRNFYGFDTCVPFSTKDTKRTCG
jgi:hypothetical protein